MLTEMLYHFQERCTIFKNGLFGPFHNKFILCGTGRRARSEKPDLKW